jgi:RNA polymerase sigma factor (TIGR02999 family)
MSNRREIAALWWILTERNMAAAVSENVTELLMEWRGGDQSALDRLLPLVYADLRKMARRCLQGERRDHTMQTTGLVHEAYLRLVQSNRVQWRDRAHFFALTAQLMRRVLVDEARKRAVNKRGGGMTRVALDDVLVAVAEPSVDVLALDEALNSLATVSPRKAQVVEMRFFGGLTIEETAAVLDVSTDIVKREWRTAKLWLARALTAAGERSKADGPGAVESD